MHSAYNGRLSDRFSRFFFLRAGPWSENRKCKKMRFSFLCFYYWDKLKQQLGVRACSTRLRAANYTASICGLPLAETNFRTAISTIISYIQTHTHTPSTHTATQRNKEAHTEKKKAPNRFLFEAPASLYHRASHRRGVNGCCFQNTWKQTNSGAHKRHSAQGGLLPWIESKGAELCGESGVLFTGKDPCEEAHCAPVQ